MSYQLFHDFFPEIAEKETRVITVVDTQTSPGVPPGEYGLLESYCNDINCDCRRIMWMVMAEHDQPPVAVIAYGWGSAHFYNHWFGTPDPTIVQEMQGPLLNPLSPQSSYAPAILNMLVNTVLKDAQYIKRVKSHYALFRHKIDTGSKRIN